MRVLFVVAALAACLLPLPDARGQSPADAAARHPVIQSLQLRNRNQDATIVVLSRDADGSSWRHATLLKPGASQRIAVPDQPWLLVRVLGRDAVRRAAGHRTGGGNDSKTLGLALAIAGGRDQDRREHEREHREDRYPDEHPPREPDGDHEHGQDGRSDRDLAAGLLLGHLGGKDDRRKGSNDDDGLAGDAGLLVAADGGGESRLGGVELDTGVGTAEGEGDDDDFLTGGSIAISQDPPPPALQAPAAADPCFCGPDVTAAYIVALQRAHDRIKALPESEKGPWDGAWFLSRNAGSMDEIARGVPIPGKSNMDEEAGANTLCPSGPCADLPGAGSGTLSICGVCLPKHVGNDIMYGFVGTLLGVPTDIQNMGGHWAQLNTAYSSLDPPQSRAAYAIGRNIAGLESPLVWGGVFNEENVCRLFSGAAHYTGNEITTPVKRNSAVGFIQQTYPALANCPRCPADATQPGTLLRDWTTSTWTLDDGTKVYPPGFDPNAPGEE